MVTILSTIQNRIKMKSYQLQLVTNNNVSKQLHVVQKCFDVWGGANKQKSMSEIVSIIKHL